CRRVSWGCPPARRPPDDAQHSSKPYGRRISRRAARFGIAGVFSMAATKGTIKRLVTDKGFGFVAAQDGSEYFFHQSACEGVRFDDLREGQSVSFEKGQGPKGPRAEHVTLA